MAIKPSFKPKPKTNTAQAKATQNAELQQLRAYYAKNGHIPTLLSNESKTRFGESDSKDVGELGRQVATGRITKEQAYERIRQGAAVNSPDSLRAGLDVSASIDPQINSTKRKRTAATEALARLTGQDNARTAQTVKDTSGIYAALQQLMGKNNAESNAGYQTAIAQNQASTASLQDQIKSAYADSNAATAARVAGMQGGTTEAQTQGNADSKFLTAIAGIQGQSQAGVLNTAQAGNASVNGANLNYSGYEGANKNATLLADLLQRTNTNNAEFAAQDLEYGGQISDLEGSRFAKLYEGKQSLADAREQAALAADDRRFSRQLASAELGVKQTNSDISATRANTDIERLGLDRQKVEIMSRQSDQKLLVEQRKYTPGTIEYQEIEASINLKRSQAASGLANAATNKQNAATNVAKLNKPGKPGSYGKGIGGVQAYLTDIGADPDSTALIMKHVSNTQQYFKDYTSGLKGIEGYIKKHKVPPEVANAMRRATGIAYGRST